jgi:protein-L-isoaspartate(D-aspartate) O-methyltransferase
MRVHGLENADGMDNMKLEAARAAGDTSDGDGNAVPRVSPPIVAPAEVRIPIEQARRFYADEIRLAAGLRNSSVWRAFATVPRERFLGPGPWRIGQVDLLRGVSYRATEDDDPCWLYHNVSVVLDESRHLVSGQPSTFARFFEDLNVQAGERVVHLGCGVGYYSAILAGIVGTAGRVFATEADPELSARAQANLAPYPGVTVHAGSDLPATLDPVGAILINAGVTHLESPWLDNLQDGGRLLAPLTASAGPTLSTGFMLKITRNGNHFVAQLRAPVVIYAAVGSAMLPSNLPCARRLKPGPL